MPYADRIGFLKNKIPNPVWDFLKNQTRPGFQKTRPKPVPSKSVRSKTY